MAEEDLYGLLGVDKNASADEIKSAYRNLAKKYHPDRFATADEKTKKTAEEKFKKITRAYEVLSDPKKKSTYDRFGSEDGPTFSSGGSFGGFEDLFSNIFNNFSSGSATYDRSPTGEDIEIKVRLSFKEACFGVNNKEIEFNRMEQCSACRGTGSKSAGGLKACPYCKGSGRVTTVKTTMFGRMQTTSTCPHCRGTGKIIADKCPNCQGRGIVRALRRMKINIPAGIENGNNMTIPREGCAAPNATGPNGNLFIYFVVESHPVFLREGVNISYELPITFLQAATGAKVQIPTLDGATTLDIPAGTRQGAVFRVRGKGVKHLRKNAFGDLYVHIVIDVPQNLSEFQRRKIRELDAVLGGTDKLRYERIEKFKSLINKG